MRDKVHYGKRGGGRGQRSPRTPERASAAAVRRGTKCQEIGRGGQGRRLGESVRSRRSALGGTQRVHLSVDWPASTIVSGSIQRGLRFTQNLFLIIHDTHPGPV